MAYFPFEATRISQQSMGQLDQKHLVAAYGNGYQQRAAIGRNSISAKWEVQVNNLSLTERNTMIAFFNAHGRVVAFEWIPPNGTAAKFVFGSPLTETSHADRYSFSITFQQVFE